MKLELDKETHVYRVDGRVVPGVTEVLRPLQDFDHVQAGVLAAAADFGQNVHEAVNLLNRGELDFDTLDLALVPYVQSWQGFLEASGAVILASEQAVYSKTYGFAGTLDAVAFWKGDAIIDVKSTAAVPRTVGPQTAAYKEARGNKKARRYCVHLQADGSPGRAHELKDPADFSIFLSALNIWKWQHKGARHAA